MNLSNQVAIVTGGASGIGQGVAHELSAEGAAVMVADLDMANAERVAQEITANGGRAAAVAVDVTDGRTVSAMAEATVAAFGTVDILVNSAGIGENTSIHAQTMEQFERIIDVNLTGSYRCIRAVMEQMMKRRYGRIVNIASVAGLRGLSGRMGYGASKSGVIGLTQNAGVELAPYNITVNAIAPGPVQTPLTDRIHPQDVREVYTRNMPLGRYGTVMEIAAGVAFLAGPRASFITGQTLAVDGGMSTTVAIFAVQ